jgi:uncharacterized membrane protein
MIWYIIQAVIILFFPALSLWIQRQKLVPRWLSPVVMCYALGILIRNLGIFPLDDPLSTTVTEVSILLALPLLLFSTNLRRWLKEARYSLLAFGLCIISGLISTTVMAFVFKDMVPDSWRISGMLTGIYTGGTPNMQAIGLALNAEQETIILLNAADIVCGGIYLVLLSSVLHSFLGKFLPSYQEGKLNELENEAADETSYSWRSALTAIAYSILIILLTVGTCYLIFGNLEQSSFIILVLTTLSIIAASRPAINRLGGTFETGEYFLLIFCVALGMLADFGDIAQNGLDILLYSAMALIGTILLHFLLSYWFKIDRDMVMITSTAAIYGPVFVGQIASAIGNKKLIFTGIALGLLGFAVGNYLGIGLAYILKTILT